MKSPLLRTRLLRPPILSTNLLLALPRLVFLPSLKNPLKSFSIPRLSPHTNQHASTAPPISAEEESAVGFDGAYLSPSEWLWKAQIVIMRVPGFYNAGNTCYLAAVLQCLLHSPSFVKAVLMDSHSPASGFRKGYQGSDSRFCVFCEVKRLVLSIHGKGNKTTGTDVVRGKAMSIVKLARNVGNICKGFEKGKQEDAHEAIMAIFHGIVRVSIAGCAQGSRLKDTCPEDEYKTAVHKAFGGCLKSTIVCLGCGKRSTSFQPHIDVSLHILKSDSVQKALERFFEEEKLTGSNRYRCSRCRQLRNATKKISLRRAPVELLLQLKRFNGVRKDCRSVHLDEKISLAKHVDVTNLSRADAQRIRKSLTYSLCSVIVHRGRFMSSGHYYAYVKEGDSWLKKDDDRTLQVSSGTVRKDEAYLVFYRRNLACDAHVNETGGPSKKVLDARSSDKKESLIMQNQNKLQSSNELTARWQGPMIPNFKGRRRRNKLGKLCQRIPSVSQSRVVHMAAQEVARKLSKRKRANDAADRELDKGRSKKVRRR